MTGSARLDTYDRIGDSLAGRYFRHKLFPLTTSELNKATKENPSFLLTKLLNRGGFPEPYLAENDIDRKRWRLQYIQSLLTIDALDIDNIQNIKAFRLVFELLRHRVASPVSYQSIAEDVQISPHTVKKYIQILEALYVVFRVTPYAKNISRSLLKEPKIYFYDTGLVEGDEERLENEVALSLLKDCNFSQDVKGTAHFLHYLRTKDGKEVDFLVADNEKPQLIIEVKQTESTISRPLRYFHEKHGFQAIQVVQHLRNEYTKDGVQVLKLDTFLAQLNI